MATVELRGIGKSFGDVNVIGNVDLKIEDGEFVVFVGPSGCGKSTLLRMIAGLEDINTGDILIDGIRMNDVPSSKRGIAMVFQSYALYPNMTLYENMAFGLKLANKTKAEIDVAVMQAARTLHMQRPRCLHHGHINFCLCLIGQLQSERHVLVQRHVWIKRIGLEDHRNAPLGRWHIVHAYSIDENIACVDVLKSRNHSQQCRLATA